jgi:hypothetical protein
MAMDPMDREPNVYNRDTNVDVRDGRGSNTLAYVIGGLVVALGLLAFLFYDGGNRDVNTTGSTATQTERSTGSTGTGASSRTAPATPSAPASPSSPASPSAPASPQQ